MSAIPTSSFIVNEPTELQDYEHLAPSAQDDDRDEGREQYQEADEHPSLPAIDGAMDLVADANIVLPPQLIEGVLHQGLKGVIGSSSNLPLQPGQAPNQHPELAHDLVRRGLVHRR
ncbi:MAG: hypothetical protein EB034_10325, partial [Verrucomicrobia bacterium]|nr:hypothetical protein [Verrucomicrobiota bacterium]